MIPSAEDDLLELEIEDEPSLNYKMNFETERVIGTCDELEAMKQVVFKILNTERYKYIIYSWDYGIELEDLFGMPVSYVCAELTDRIKEALTQDDRINDVSDFSFDFPKKSVIHVSFTVETIFGNIEAEREVTI